MVVLHVSDQVVISGELFLATFDWTFPRCAGLMRLDVLVQIAFLVKGLGASVARIGKHVFLIVVSARTGNLTSELYVGDYPRMGKVWTYRKSPGLLKDWEHSWQTKLPAGGGWTCW